MSGVTSVYYSVTCFENNKTQARGFFHHHKICHFANSHVGW